MLSALARWTTTRPRLVLALTLAVLIGFVAAGHGVLRALHRRFGVHEGRGGRAPDGSREEWPGDANPLAEPLAEGGRA
jgi:hypothetical protein